MAQQSSLSEGEAGVVVERLSAVTRSRPLDRARAESAIAEHLRALELEPRAVRWIQAPDADHIASAHEAFVAAWTALWAHNKGRPHVGMTSTATFAALYGAGLRRGGVLGEAEKEEKKAGWKIKRQAHKAQKEVVKRLEGAIEQASRHADLERAVEDALAEKGIGRRTTMSQAIGSTPEVQRARQDAEMNQEIAKADPAEQAGQAAAWFARAQALKAAGEPAGALERAARVYLPLVDAVEAGLWLFWPTPDEVIAVSVPASG